MIEQIWPEEPATKQEMSETCQNLTGLVVGRSSFPDRDALARRERISSQALGIRCRMPPTFTAVDAKNLTEAATSILCGKDPIAYLPRSFIDCRDGLSPGAFGWRRLYVDRAHSGLCPGN